MATRIIIFLLASLLITFCATAKKSVVMAGEKEQEILYIYPDGRMEFDGRFRNEEDVVIYDNGRGGENAALKIIVPSNRYSKESYKYYYRDSIEVERKEIDAPVVREK